MHLILNTIYVITISLANGDLITFEIGEELCFKRTTFLSKHNEHLDLLEVYFSSDNSNYEFDLLTDTLKYKSLDSISINKDFYSAFEFSSDYINDRKITIFTTKLNRYHHYAHFLLEVEEVKQYSKRYPKYFMIPDNYLYLSPGIYADHFQNSEHYPIKVTVEKRNDFTDLFKSKLQELKK